MVNICKETNDNGYCIKINTDDGCFEIVFCDNLDLYWIYRYNGIHLFGGRDKG